MEGEEVYSAGPAPSPTSYACEGAQVVTNTVSRGVKTVFLTEGGARTE